jgi:PAS domain S-box-containing protein
VTSEPYQIRNCRLFSLAAGAASVFVGALVVVGWMFHVPALTSILPGLASMKPLTASCFIFCGVAICALRLAPGENHVTRIAYLRVAQVLAGSVLCVALLTLGEYLFALDFRIDQILFRQILLATGVAHPGRMSASTAIGFFLLGGSLLSLESNRRTRYLSQTCALLVALDGLIAFVGYLYQVSALYGVAAYSSMALHTAMLMVLLGLASLAARPHIGLMEPLVSQRLGGLMGRRTLPLIVLSQIVIGLLRWRAEQAGFFDTAFGVCLFVLSNIVIFSLLLVWSAAWINRVDAARKRAEESDLRLAAIVESSIDPIIGMDLNGIVTSWNKSAEELFGYSGREIVGRSLNILIPPEKREEEQRILQLIRQGERVEPGDTVRIRKDGKAIDVAATISPLRDRQGNIHGAAKIVRDVTERRRVTQELYEQAAVLDLAQVLVRDMDNRIVLWNTGAEKLYGFTRDEALGQNPNYLLKTRFPKPFEEIQEQFHNSGRWEGELIHTRSDGREIAIYSLWILHRNAQGLPVRILEANTDVTEQKLAQQQLALQADELARQAEEVSRSEAALSAQSRILQSVLDNIADGLIAADLDGNFMIWNPAADRILGQSRSDISPAEWSSRLRIYQSDKQTLFPADDLPLAHAIRGEESSAEMFVRSPNSERGAWIEVSARPLRDEHGQLVGGVAAFRDVTQRKLADHEIRKLNFELEARVLERTAQLEAANRELESFSYSVSHDLRAPLRQISGFARILQEDFADRMEPEARKHLQRIEDGGRNMSRLVDELLNLSKLGRQQLTRRRVALNPLIEEVRSILLTETLGRHIEWRIAELSPLECDATLMKQVFQNLISNALKYSRKRAETCIEIGENISAGETTIFVRDNGVGFDMKYANKLFGVFQRLHKNEEFEGIGIGLATTNSIIQKHGGRLWADATPDEGATFYFTLTTQEPKAKTATAE